MDSFSQYANETKIQNKNLIKYELLLVNLNIGAFRVHQYNGNKLLLVSTQRPPLTD